MSVRIPGGIKFEQKDGVLIAVRQTEEQRALHGLARALVANAVHGVTQGFKKDLDIVGVGYRAEVKGKNVVFALGYSHPVEFPIPEGIQIAVEKQTHMTVTGADKGQVGPGCRQSARLRPPDPYKQKGVRITGERLKKKAGKAGAAKTAGISGSRATRFEEIAWLAIPVRKLSRSAHRKRIHSRLRRTLTGNTERPRLCVHRSAKHIHAQVIDDSTGRTLVAASSLDRRIAQVAIKGGGNIAAAKVSAKPSPNAPKRRASKKSCLIVAATNITAA